ncbi:MAG: phosphoribosyltransferase [Propionibacteriaceae bacterium]|jgi:hypoxanthine phosphoribosyltransferase|nr:phosphoribosyltransferase [Propionibacteriaceae bacterium]
MDGGKEILTWDDFGAGARVLAQQIVDSGFDPDVMIAVARGGMIPTGAISYALGKKLNDCINVEFYIDAGRRPTWDGSPGEAEGAAVAGEADRGEVQTLPDPVLLPPLLDAESLEGKRLLVVDDVVDSGRTMALVQKLLRGFGAEVRTCVLYAKPTTVVVPDYVWRRTDKWIVFPWSAEPPVVAMKRGE